MYFVIVIYRQLIDYVFLFGGDPMTQRLVQMWFQGHTWQRGFLHLGLSTFELTYFCYRQLDNEFVCFWLEANW